MEKWAYFLKHGEELDEENLPDSLREPDYRKAVKELAVFTQKEKERALYEARRKALMDERSRLGDAHRRGIQEGKEVGLKEGVEKAKREMVIACLKQNMERDTIQELTGISLQEIEKIHQQITRS